MFIQTNLKCQLASISVAKLPSCVPALLETSLEESQHFPTLSSHVTNVENIHIWNGKELFIFLLRFHTHVLDHQTRQ